MFRVNEICYYLDSISSSKCKIFCWKKKLSSFLYKVFNNDILMITALVLHFVHKYILGGMDFKLLQHTKWRFYVIGGIVL